MNSKNLVTGITGMVGAHLALHLIQNGEEVIGLIRSQKSKEKTKGIFKLYDALDLFKLIEWREADVTKVETLESALKGVQIIYHCAAFISFRPQDEDEMYRINVLGTRNIVNVALTLPIEHFCHVSSTAAIGGNRFNEPTTEKHVWERKEASSYSISKKLSELEVWRAIEEGLKAVIVNPCVIIGPGDWTQGSPQLIEKVANGLKYTVPGSNAFVDVRDVVAIMHELVLKGITEERYLLIGENAPYDQLFKIIAKHLNIPGPTKMASRTTANILAFIEYWRCKLLGGYPMITSDSIDSAYSNVQYSNGKIKSTIQYDFKGLEEMVGNATVKYLKQ